MTEKSGEKGVLKVNRYPYADVELVKFEDLVRAIQACRDVWNSLFYSADKMVGESAQKEFRAMADRVAQISGALNSKRDEMFSSIAYTYVGEMHEGKEDESDR